MEKHGGAVMLTLPDEVAVRTARLPDLARRSVEAFLAEHAIDRGAVEKLVMGTWPAEARLFYVSTVARGLAGSRSDLDFIIVGDADLGRSTLSSMLFHQERRIGVKYHTEHQIERSFALMAAACAGPDAPGLGGSGAAAMPIGWADLERLVHGHSPVAGTPYAGHLATVCAWALDANARQFREVAAMAHLAASGELDGALRGYACKASIAAMDCVMAAHGHVQSNWKWTHERWARFRPDLLPGMAEFAGAIDRLAVAAGSPDAGAGEVVDRLDRVADLLGFASRDPGVDVAADIRQIVQLDTARALVGGGRLAIVPEELSEAMFGAAIASLTPAAAAAAVDLVGHGLLTISPRGRDA